MSSFLVASLPQGMVSRTIKSSVMGLQPLSARSWCASRNRVITRAEGEFDIDAVVEKYSGKFEKAEKKPVIIGYGVAAVAALFITEWLIHLPLLDFLLGFPIQLVGVIVAPILILRYVVDKKDWEKDVDDTVERIAELLPGLKKE